MEAIKPSSSLINKALNVPYKTLMGPGPSNCPPRVLKAMSQPILGHLNPECLKIMDDIKEGIQYIFQTKNRLTLAISASGHSGIEAVMCNILEFGEKVLIAVNGIWGQRASMIAKRYGAIVCTVDSAPGNNFSLIQIENAIIKHQPVLLFITQGESSTGVYQNIEGIGDICRMYNCLLAVDTVASLGGVPILADHWGIDIIYTGSQKVLGAPPGLTPISFSARAEKRIFSRKTPVPVYYWDMTVLGDYWNCFGNSRFYHHTISSTLLYGLREGLAIIAAEGIENVIKRHQNCAKRLHEGLERIGLELFVNDLYKRLPTVTSVKIPNNLNWRDISGFAMQRYSLEISGGLGPTTDKILRIGLMGHNATFRNVDFVLQVLNEAVEYLNCLKICKL